MIDYEIEQQGETVKALKTLVKAFDCDEGMSEEVYNATCNLLDVQLAGPAAREFSKSIEATDGRFYFRGGLDYETLRKIFWMEELG